MTEAPLTAPTHASCHHKIYGLTCAEFDELVRTANGHCQRCGIPDHETPKGKLVIDHCHQGGRRPVRGLICSKCNSLMGRVDAGLTPADEATVAYLALSEAGRQYQLFDIPDGTWGALGKAFGTRGRLQVCVDAVEWCSQYPTPRLEPFSEDDVAAYRLTIRQSPTGRRLEVRQVWGDMDRDTANEIATAIVNHFAPPTWEAGEAAGKRAQHQRDRVGTHPPLHQVRVSNELWMRFGAAVQRVDPGLDRSRVLREFMSWYIGEKGARLPQRPPPRHVNAELTYTEAP